MSNIVSIIQQLDRAFEAKDQKAYGALLHEDYKFQGALMAMNSKAEAVEFLVKCPFKAKVENSQHHMTMPLTHVTC
jgi:nucleoid-associated protein YejK